jgi:phosphate transport system protein
MGNFMADKHLSSQFDVELNALCSSLLEMGGMVESQILDATKAFSDMDIELCKVVIDREKTINTKEIDIDLACTEIIAKRQPTARDLRLVMAVSKAITNLERAGDEAEKVAKRTRRIIRSGAEHKINVAEIIISGQLALKQLRQSWMLLLDWIAMQRLKLCWTTVRLMKSSELLFVN